jgi:hypothetical protein
MNLLNRIYKEKRHKDKEIIIQKIELIPKKTSRDQKKQRVMIRMLIKERTVKFKKTKKGQVLLEVRIQETI